MNKPIIIDSANANLMQQSYELLKQLRPHLSFEAFSDTFIEAQKNSNYKMVVIEESKLVALMGYRILHDFVHGKHLYIDDLVSSENYRSRGYGRQLLKYAETLAQESGCSNLRLCTGIENEAGKRFYEENNWNLRAVVYKKKL